MLFPVLFWIVGLLADSGLAFQSPLVSKQLPTPVTCNGKSGDEQDVDPLTKAAWFGVEVFGKAFGKSDSKSVVESGPPRSMQETFDRIQADNDREYFLSGEIDSEIYDVDCTFADPFVSFDGRDRFVENLVNLGSFITEYSAKPLEYKTSENAVSTKFMVKLQLNLPWKPVLAWPWGVTCEIDPSTFLVVRHEESWDVTPLAGVQQIFRKPTTTVS